MRAGDCATFLIYTDGACSGNPGPGGWAAIVLDREGFVRELGGACGRTTNNRMEIFAASEALRFIAGLPGRVRLCTDSAYLISGITRWLPEWKRKGWVRADGGEALNRDLWEELEAWVRKRRQGVCWNYVRGHSDNPGNSRCDEIAVAFSQGGAPILYQGPLSSYGIDLTAPAAETLPVPSRCSVVPKKSGWYLSLLDGRLERHQSWAECQTRVHCRPALFKKVSSPQEESAILKKWGLA